MAQDKHRLFLWSHIITPATNDDKNVLEVSFVLTDEKLRSWAHYTTPVAVADDEHIDLLRLRVPAEVRKRWDDSNLWEDVTRDGVAIHLVDYYIGLAINDSLEEHRVYPEDVSIHLIGNNVEQARRIIVSQLPTLDQTLEAGGVNTAALVSAFRFFLPDMLSSADEEYLDRLAPIRATEVLDAEIGAFELLMSRIPSKDNPARRVLRGEPAVQ